MADPEIPQRSRVTRAAGAPSAWHTTSHSVAAANSNGSEYSCPASATKGSGGEMTVSIVASSQATNSAPSIDTRSQARHPFEASIHFSMLRLCK
jgi:hypothetical protein